MTTYASLVSTVSGITITGVSRALAYIPEAGDTADLPLSFVRLPGGGTNPATLTTCAGDGKARNIELVVLIEPVGQSTASANFAATVAMCDNVETALNTLGDFMPMVEYTIRAEGYSEGLETGFWAVIAAITGIE